MGKKNLSDQFASPSSESHGSLRSFIDTLYRLFIKISSRLRNIQIHESAMGEAKSDYDIGKKLSGHIDKVAAESQSSTKSHSGGKALAADSNTQEDTAATTSQSSPIAKHSKRKATDRLLPSMSEQLQKNTMEHINISLILAKEGNTEGARLHIKLAENAMHAASRFMSYEEHAVFKQKVERRLDSIVDRDRRSDAGA